MKCFCGVDLVPLNHDNARKICPACKVEYASGGDPLPTVVADEFFLMVDVKKFKVIEGEL